MNNIILVGFMGTGKSVVSKLLAGILNREVVDTDDLVVRTAGKPIPVIFKEDGEIRFRQLETDVLKNLMANQLSDMVIATGGGIVLKEENWSFLKTLGKVICLTAKPDTIVKRVGNGRGRPLLEGAKEEVWERINTLLINRKEAYGHADWICETDNKTPEEVAAAINDWCNN